MPELCINSLYNNILLFYNIIMSLLNFNSNNKSWKMYLNTITSIANDDLLIKPNNGNNIILEVSANNNIILKRGDISYSINTKFTSIDSSFTIVSSKFTTIDTSFSDVDTKFFIIDASFNNKLASISGNIVPLNDICYNLGIANKSWANAYIRDLSVTNIDVSVNLNPLIPNSGNIGIDVKQWASAYIKDLSGLVNINGQPYVAGTSSINLENVTTNINPSINNTLSLGIASKRWGNAYIRNLNVSSIDVSVNLYPLYNNTGSLGNPKFILSYTYSLDTTPRNWSQHKINAETVPNRYLAAILNEEDNIKARALIGTIEQTWIGARRKIPSTTNDKTSLNWYWDTGEPWYYHNWDSFEPGTLGEGSVAIRPNGKWHDYPSTDTFPALYMTYTSFIPKRWGNAYIRDLSVDSIDISVNLNPLISNSGSLGTLSKIWRNAYIRDISVSNISASGNIIPLVTLSGSLGISTNVWNSAYIKDIIGVVNINGEPYISNFQSIIANPPIVNPLTTNIRSLGLATKYWGNAYIRNTFVSSIDVSVNLNPLVLYDMSATGGTVIIQNEYAYHIFTVTGQNTFVPLLNGTVEVLLVGGGGSGGQVLGSGGGGGGVIWMPSITVSAGQNYPIFVGAGGTNGNNGETTTAFNASAGGGGRGISHKTSSGSGIAGGSGSGAAYAQGQTIIYNGGAGNSGNSLGPNRGFIYGNKGGNMLTERISNPLRQAGGGGAGRPGLDTDVNIHYNTGQNGAGSGGEGVLNRIYLERDYYWGGGGGGGTSNTIGGWGGLGGGGGGAGGFGVGIGGGRALNSGANGGFGGNTNGGAGGANTGGGGGGGEWEFSVGGAGGSGIVVIRYLRQINNSSLGIIYNPWRNAYINNLNTMSLDISVNLNPVTTNTGSLGSVSKRWNNAYISDLSVVSMNTSSLVIGDFFSTNFPTTNPALPIRANISNISRFSTSDNFGLTLVDIQSTGLDRWCAINVEARGENNTHNRAGIQFSLKSIDGTPGNIWNINCRDNNNQLRFNKVATFNSQTDTSTTTASLTPGGTITAGSDDRLKHNEIIINNGLTIIDKLVPKFYQKTEVMLDANYNGDLSGYAWSYEAGLIAQEVLQINDISFAVSAGDLYDLSNNVIPNAYGVSYSYIFVYGLAAIKELHTKVKIQKSSILNIQSRIVNIQSSILNQQTTINSLITRIEALKNKVS